MTAARSRGGRTDESTDRRSATKQKLQEELASLRARLAYAEQMLEAIAHDEVDAFVVLKRERGTEQVLTMDGAHLPYQHFVESMRDGALTLSGDGTILHANRGFAELTGAAEPVGQPIASFIAASDAAVMLQNAGDTPLVLRTTLRLADGSIVPAALSASVFPLQDARRIGVLVTPEDGKKAGAVVSPSAPSLVHASSGLVRVESLLAQIPTGLLLVDPATGRIIYANRRAEQILGRALVGLDRPLSDVELACWRPDGTIVEPGDRPAAKVLRGAEPVLSEELVRERGDGTRVHTRTSAAALHDGDGALAAVVVTFEDMSEEIAVRAQLEANQRFRDLFIAVLGHDLRDPLAAIANASYLLMESFHHDPKAVRILERVQRSTKRMARMIDEVLDFTRTRLAGGLKLRRATVYLDELVGTVVADLQTSYPRRAIALSLEGGLSGEWDADRITQVLWNLVGNALVHGYPDKPVAVSTRREGDWVRLEVHNEGPPIAADLLPVIFDPFRRAELNDRNTGLGLGLYIAQQIVRAHHGTLTVTSAADRGTTFTALLPRVPVD